MLLSVNDPRISRVTRSKEQARKSYDHLSRWYDWLAGASEWKWTRLALQHLNAQEGEHVLEIGFGTGRALQELTQSVGESGRVFGVDISPGMLAVSQRRLAKAGLSERAELRLGDAAALPFNDGSMHAVFISFTLELFDTPEIPVVLAECRRVMRSGGRLVVLSLVMREPKGVAIRLYEWAHENIPNYVDCRPIYLQEAIESADFNNNDTREFSMWGLPGEIVIARKAT